jgi:TPR repeat protein
MLLMASSVLAQSGFDKGASAYKRGDFETALVVFRPLAEKGDAKAQSILGLMYSYGEGVPVDYRESARWYRRAAEQNSSVAQYNLGMLYLEGKGVSQNTDEAIKWLTNAADGGHFRARSELAKLPPTMTTAESEPRSVVMRKPAPPAPEPKISTTTATATMASAAVSPTPAQTNNNAQSSARAPQPSASSNRVYRVQLAASRSEEYIRRDWSSYQKRHSDIFDGLDGSVERAEVGEEKTVWYRLRVGPFESEASAKKLCAKLATSNIKTGCLPVRTTR